MFKLNDIKELIRSVDKSSIDELIIKGENKNKLTIRKHAVKQTNVPSQTVTSFEPAAVISTPIQETSKPQQLPRVDMNQPETENLQKITSPMVGTFYSAPSPDAQPYVKTGDKVVNETVVCIVEAMKLMNELEAETTGEIVEILVENGQLVEYGQALFLVRQA